MSDDRWAQLLKICDGNQEQAMEVVMWHIESSNLHIQALNQAMRKAFRLLQQTYPLLGDFTEGKMNPDWLDAPFDSTSEGGK